METVRSILIAATPAEWNALSSAAGGKVLTDLTTVDATQRYVLVQELMLMLQALGESVFFRKTDYGELVRYTAEYFGLTLEGRSSGCTVQGEWELAQAYVLRLWPELAKAERQTLWAGLGLAPTAVVPDVHLLRQKLALVKDETALAAVFGWLTLWLPERLARQAETRQGFGWNYPPIPLLPEQVLYPIFYVAWLRHQQRCRQLSHCRCCTALLREGTRFCSACGEPVTVG